MYFIFGLIALTALLSGGFAWTRHHKAPRKTLRICMQAVPFAGSIVLADQAGLFAREGIDLTYDWVATGPAAMARLIAGECDLIVCNETPIVLVTMRNHTVNILASIASTEEGHGILARIDRGIVKVQDLQGKKIGCVPETLSDFLLDTVLDFNGMAFPSVERISGTPDELERAMREGQLDALCIWSPISDRMLTALEGRLMHLRVEVATRAYWNLVGRPDLDRDLGCRALRAIRAAGLRINVEPLDAAELCSATLRIPVDELISHWSRSDFSTQLDQALIMGLENQARWAMRKGYALPQPLPNFLSVITPSMLAEVEPQLVTMIHPAVKP